MIRHATFASALLAIGSLAIVAPATSLAVPLSATQEQPDTEAAVPVPHDSLHCVGFSVDTSLFYDATNRYRVVGGSDPVNGFVGVGMTGTMRFGMWRVGGFVEFESDLFGPAPISVGALAGPTWLPASWMRVDADVELGATYALLSDGLFEHETRGGDTLLPFAGARLSASLRLGRDHAFLLGPYVSLREDLSRTTQVVTTSNCLLGCGQGQETWNVGGGSVVAGLRAGFEF